MLQKDSSARKRVTWHVAMTLGGISGMVAKTAVHPLDLIKVRIQLLTRYCTTREMARQIVRCRGYAALYTGLTAGLMRQTTYTTTRVGAYHAMYNVHQSKTDRRPVLVEKIAFSVIAGVAGALAGNPSEVVLVRLMGNGPLEPCLSCTEPRTYTGAFQATKKICQEEGVKALWRGGTLTISRSLLISIGQIETYTQVRNIFRERNLGNKLTLDLSTSLISSFFTAIISLPIDLVKTRYQVEQSGVKLSDIFTDIHYHKGILFFWKGFTPYYIRMAVHTVTSLLVIDWLYQLYLKNYETKFI